MTIGLNVQDGGILYNILANLSGDIVVRIDTNGFVQEASTGLAKAGIDLDQMLIAPHLADLTDAVHAEHVREYFAQALTNTPAIAPLEFPLCPEDRAPQWYALTVQPIPSTGDGHPDPVGAIGILRCVENTRVLHTRLVESALTDPLTGIPNRRAFFETVGRMMDKGMGGIVALFEIDRFRAIGLRFGQQSSDEVIKAFASFLANMIDDGQILARLEDNRFAVLMPFSAPRQAIDHASEVVATFAEISRDAELEEMRLTASASVCQLSECLDETLVRGEVALTMARSAGGFRVECGDAIRQSWKGRKSA